ncbi:DUF2442 domain-containing protein [Indiicoccus explosivorum]|uniref:DUF2442 domain-containing protein n=1 Tax=Indiicoccus explosivorum TaxID=1917864 RepID=UPI000B431832|nr:DUF2442 domain-containing protein [Indiicoccus explosivorum]
MREIVQAVLLDYNGWLLCEFDNGVKKFVDIKPSMTGILEKLHDRNFFNKVYIDSDAGTVAWPGEMHLDPDTLYARGIDIQELEKLLQASQEAINDDRLKRA